jgi:hypothetical protein
VSGEWSNVKTTPYFFGNSGDYNSGNYDILEILEVLEILEILEEKQWRDAE